MKIKRILQVIFFHNYWYVWFKFILRKNWLSKGVWVLWLENDFIKVLKKIKFSKPRKIHKITLSIFFNLIINEFINIFCPFLGAQAAYKAYQMWLKNDGKKGKKDPQFPELAQFDDNQLFWIAFSQYWLVSKKFFVSFFKIPKGVTHANSMSEICWPMYILRAIAGWTKFCRFGNLMCFFINI